VLSAIYVKIPGGKSTPMVFEERKVTTLRPKEFFFAKR